MSSDPVVSRFRPPSSAEPAALQPVPADRPDELLSIDELGSRIVGMAARLAAATCRWLLLVAAFDARDGCSSLGLASTARWLSHTCGIAHRTAVDQVRVARALALFPPLSAAMSAGRLSYSHVRAIARLAREGEQQLVADLVEVAEHGTVGQLEDVVRGLRTVDDNESAGDGEDAPVHYLRHSWTSTSHWRLDARLDPERGALVQSAVEQLARAEAISQVDALVRLAEIGLTALADGDKAPRPLRGDERAAVVVHLYAATDGSHGTAHADEPADLVEPGEAETAPTATRAGRRETPLARLRNGPGLPRRVVERLLCAARIRTVVRSPDDDGAVNLGRSHRVVTDHQFRVLLLRDGHCRHPGCTSTHRLEAHHVRHWIDGGTTDFANLVMLCERHHHAHHDGEFTIRLAGRDGFAFHRRDGRRLPASIDRAALVGTSSPIADDLADELPDDCAVSRRNGDRLDRPYAVGVLASRRTLATAS